MADFLDDLYEAKWHKFRSSRKYSDILTVLVVSLLKVVEDLVCAPITQTAGTLTTYTNYSFGDLSY